MGRQPEPDDGRRGGRDADGLRHVHVLPAHRGRGLGRELLDLLADDVRRSGYGVVALGVHRDNPARALYERAGFTATGEDGDHLLFRRAL